MEFHVNMLQEYIFSARLLKCEICFRTKRPTRVKELIFNDD